MNDDIAFVIAWTGGENIPASRSRFRMFNSGGTSVGDEVATKHALGSSANHAMTSVLNGMEPREFVNVLGGGNVDVEQLLTARLYHRNGNSLQTNITHVGDHTVNFDPAAATLPDGTIVVTWAQKKEPTTGIFGNNIMAALLSVRRNSGDFLEVLGPLVQVNTAHASGQNSPSVVPVVDAFNKTTIAFAWVDEKLDGPAQSPIKARVLSGTLGPV